MEGCIQDPTAGFSLVGFSLIDVQPVLRDVDRRFGQFDVLNRLDARRTNSTQLSEPRYLKYIGPNHPNEMTV